MEPGIYLHFAKATLLAYWGFWLALAASGHFLDAGTNRHLLGEMMGMNQLKADPLLGKGIIGRAWTSPAVSRLALVLIAIYQLAVAYLLLRAAWQWLAAADASAALAAADLALVAFGSIWCFFLAGGLWFGYWIKTPLLQQVHLTLLLLTLASTIFIHTRF